MADDVGELERWLRRLCCEESSGSAQPCKLCEAPPVLVQRFEHCGMGFVATRRIACGDVMVSLEAHGMALSDHELLCVHMLCERERGAGSRWKHYMPHLPHDTSYTLLCCMNESEFESVFPRAHGEREVERLRERWRRDRADLAEMHARVTARVEAAVDSIRGETERTRDNATCSADRVAPTEPLEKHLAAVRRALAEAVRSAERFTWAHCTVMSRSCTVPWDSVGALVPFGDFLNHEAGAAPVCDALPAEEPSNVAQLPGLDSAGSHYHFTAHRSFDAGEQVFVCYGAHGNAELLSLYGFALRRNSFEEIEVDLPDHYARAVAAGRQGMPSGARRAGSYGVGGRRKKRTDMVSEALLAQAEAHVLHGGCVMTIDGPSYALLLSLRVRMMDADEVKAKLWWRAVQGEMVSHSNEDRVTSYLREWCAQTHARLRKCCDLEDGREAPLDTHSAACAEQLRAWVECRLTILQTFIDASALS